MKLNEILSEQDEFEAGPTEHFLSDDEMGLAYNILKRRQLSKEEIADIARQLVDEGRYPRSVNSLIFLLSRMHILLHGVAPEGETPNRASTMFNIPRRLAQFVVDQGDLDWDDLHYHIEEAKRELAERPVTKKLTREDALKAMSDFYKANRASLPKDIVQHREEIVQDIMNGVPPDQAFAKYA